ncbi:hypothetical protein C0995_015878 [Termitomyces sp. Mi166|nr:hypothetical protein C0995_015878 [Termitomyces sp. Mi166\
MQWEKQDEVRMLCIMMWRMHKKEAWCMKFGKTVTSWESAICTEEQVRLMHFAKLASEVEAIESTPAALELGTRASLPIVMAGEQELYDDLDEKEKAQALSELLSRSEAPLTQEEMSGSRRKGKGKELAVAEEGSGRLLLKLMDMVEDERLEGGKVIMVGNKAKIILASCKKWEQAKEYQWKGVRQLVQKKKPLIDAMALAQ